MNSILITGCNRGLGLGLVKAFASKSLKQEKKLPKYIFATCRSVDMAKVRKISFVGYCGKQKTK